MNAGVMTDKQVVERIVMAYNMAKVRLQTAKMYCWRSQAEESHEIFIKEFESNYIEQYNGLFEENQKKTERRAKERLSSLFKPFVKEMEQTKQKTDELDFV